MLRILTTYYNSPNYVERCISSIKEQTVQNWKCYITNDCSTDGSEKIIEELIKDDDRFELINNKIKMWQTGNYWQVVNRSEISDGEICVTIDGDDWLPDPLVFERVYSYYMDGKTLMTFGQYKEWKGGEGFLFPRMVRKPNPFSESRNLPWTSSHLRTFKAGLFRRIRKEDLMKPDGSGFIEVAGDVVCFNPCLEMAGEDRVKYVQDINYVYNSETPLNECKNNVNYSFKIVKYIGQKPKYQRI